MGKTLSNPQTAVVYRDGYDALKRMLDGFDSITVGRWLMEEGYWPHGPEITAGARVRACCNPDKTEFFKFSEIIFLMVRTGQCHPLYFACDATNHQRPKMQQTAQAAADKLAAEIRERERELEELRSTHRAAMTRVRDEVYPSKRGISRIRFSLWGRR